MQAIHKMDCLPTRSLWEAWITTTHFVGDFQTKRDFASMQEREIAGWLEYEICYSFHHPALMQMNQLAKRREIHYKLQYHPELMHKQLYCMNIWARTRSLCLSNPTWAATKEISVTEIEPVRCTKANHAKVIPHLDANYSSPEAFLCGYTLLIYYSTFFFIIYCL
jgi:hypothetical protein